MTKRKQIERLAIAETLVSSVWEEICNGSIEEGILQTAANLQINVNRIVWKLNAINNEGIENDNHTSTF